MQWYQGAVDAIKSKLYFPVSQKMSRKHQQNICHIEFFNKAVEYINPSVIFNNINLTSKLNES